MSSRSCVINESAYPVTDTPSGHVSNTASCPFGVDALGSLTATPCAVSATGRVRVSRPGRPWAPARSPCSWWA